MEIPKADVWHTEENVEVAVELPGLSETEIELTLSSSHDALLLRGVREDCSERNETKEGWYRSERYYGLIQRSIPLPCPVKLGDAVAKMKNGVLRVTLRKREDSPEAKRITVRPE